MQSSMLILFLLPCITAMPFNSDLSDTDGILYNLIKTAGDRTTTDFFEAIEKTVGEMGEEVQAAHRKWNQQILEEEIRRMQSIKDALPSLSKKAQSRLIRLVMVHQNRSLKLSEKRELLQRLSRDMDPEVRKELITKIPESTLFTLVY